MPWFSLDDPYQPPRVPRLPNWVNRKFCYFFIAALIMFFFISLYLYTVIIHLYTGAPQVHIYQGNNEKGVTEINGTATGNTLNTSWSDNASSENRTFQNSSGVEHQVNVLKGMDNDSLTPVEENWSVSHVDELTQLLTTEFKNAMNDENLTALYTIVQNISNVANKHEYNNLNKPNITSVDNRTHNGSLSISMMELGMQVFKTIESAIYGKLLNLSPGWLHDNYLGLWLRGNVTVLFAIENDIYHRDEMLLKNDSACEKVPAWLKPEFENYWSPDCHWNPNILNVQLQILQKIENVFMSNLPHLTLKEGRSTGDNVTISTDVIFDVVPDWLNDSLYQIWLNRNMTILIQMVEDIELRDMLLIKHKTTASCMEKPLWLEYEYKHVWSSDCQQSKVLDRIKQEILMRIGVILSAEHLILSKSGSGDVKFPNVTFIQYEFDVDDIHGWSMKIRRLEAVCRKIQDVDYHFNLIQGMSGRANDTSEPPSVSPDMEWYEDPENIKHLYTLKSDLIEAIHSYMRDFGPNVATPWK